MSPFGVAFGVVFGDSKRLDNQGDGLDVPGSGGNSPELPGSSRNPPEVAAVFGDVVCGAGFSIPATAVQPWLNRPSNR